MSEYTRLSLRRGQQVRIVLDAERGRPQVALCLLPNGELAVHYDGIEPVPVSFVAAPELPIESDGTQHRDGCHMIEVAPGEWQWVVRIECPLIHQPRYVAHPRHAWPQCEAIIGEHTLARCIMQQGHEGCHEYAPE